MLGQKILCAQMPTLIDILTAEAFKPTLLVSTKRVPTGFEDHIRQMNATTALLT